MGSFPKDRSIVESRSLTKRAILLGLVCVAGEAALTPCADFLLQGTHVASSHLPMLPLLTFAFLIVIVNSALVKLTPRWRFSQGELYVVYIMMLVGALIPSFGMTMYLIPSISGTNYFATPENGWASTFYQHIKPWMVPFDPQSRSQTAQLAMKQFYEGIPASKPIPWGVWVRPLAAWSAFAFCLFFVWTCLSTILRKQWVDNEKLTFPLVQLPTEMARQGDGSCWGGNPFFRSKMMWLGFCIPAILHSFSALHMYLPNVPNLELTVYLHRFLPPPWGGGGLFIIFVYFSVIGFSFLISSEVSFSLWAFYFLFKLFEAITIFLGMEHRFTQNYAVVECEAYQMFGAFLVFFGYMVYLSRRQLADVVGKALHGTKGIDDHNESLSYRTAFFGLIFGTIFLAGWCWLAGMSFLLALGSLLFFYLIAVCLTRFIAEGGILFVQAPFAPTDVIAGVSGIGAVGPASITVLSFVERIFMTQQRGMLMPSLLDSMKLSDDARLNRRRLAYAMAASIFVAAVVSYITLIYIGYRKGGAMNLNSWLSCSMPSWQAEGLKQAIVLPRPRDLTNAPFAVVGAAVMLFLVYMRSAFAWWPLHPIGYIMGASSPMVNLWFSIFVGWLLKTLILRYGGMKGFVRARPFCLGLVLGEFGISVFWVAVNAVTGTKGFYLFLN